MDDAQDIDIVMPMYDLVKCNDICSKKSGSLWQYYTNVPALDHNDNIIDFPAKNNNSILLKFKQQMTGKTGNGDTENVEIMVSLKYLIIFWSALETSLISL